MTVYIVTCENPSFSYEAWPEKRIVWAGTDEVAAQKVYNYSVAKKSGIIDIEKWVNGVRVD